MRTLFLIASLFCFSLAQEGSNQTPPKNQKDVVAPNPVPSPPSNPESAPRAANPNGATPPGESTPQGGLSQGESPKNPPAPLEQPTEAAQTNPPGAKPEAKEVEQFKKGADLYEAPIPKKRDSKDDGVKPSVHFAPRIRVLLDNIRFEDINRFSRDIKIGKKGVKFRGVSKPFEFNLVEFDVPKDKPVLIQKDHYYDKILFYRPNAQQRVFVINEMDVEDYLVGVLSAEIPASWHINALRTQAIVSRTYAYYHLRAPVSQYYDVVSTTDNQVFYGLDKRSKAHKDAVDSTKDIVIVYDRQLIEPFFTSNNGGLTEIPQDVWGSTKEYPYYDIIVSPFDEGQPGYAWEVNLRDDDLARRLGSKKGVTVNSIEILGYNAARRVKEVKASFSDEKEVVYSGNDFRNKVGNTVLKSTMLEVEKVGNIFFFKGRGFGHGVGLSQWGASVQATSGRNVLDIIRYYYKGVRLARLKI